MMSLRQFYLLKLIEECQEVAQRASKSMQFGPFEVQPEQEKVNAERLHDEVIDLEAVIELLKDTPDLGHRDWSVRIKAITNKKEKIQKYLKYSQDLGMVEKSTTAT